MRDTPVSTEVRFREMILSQSPSQRLAMACRMFSTAKALVRAGILQEFGELNAEDIRERIFQRIYGRDFSASDLEKILRYLRST